MRKFKTRVLEITEDGIDGPSFFIGSVLTWSLSLVIFFIIFKWNKS